MTTIIAGMAVEIRGARDPVLLVHGLGGTANTFAPLFEALRGHRAVLPDLPGAGRSALPATPPTLAAMADGLARLIELLNLGRAHLVGHSLGTILCQMLAAERPDLVRSLCLFGALAEPPEPARAGLRQRAATARAEGMEPIAEAVANGSLAAASRRDTPAAFAFVRESLMRQCPRGYAASCEALADARAADAARIACPTLIITGADDPVAPPNVGRQLAERIQGARSAVLPACGHWPTIEAPREAARLLAEFLAGPARQALRGARAAL